MIWHQSKQPKKLLVLALLAKKHQLVCSHDQAVLAATIISTTDLSYAYFVTCCCDYFGLPFILIADRA